MRKIQVSAGNVTVIATLNSTSTANAIWGALPIQSTANLWGEEVYFEVPVKMGEDNAQPEVPSGTVAYWPAGHCLCLFFGQKPYSPVNVVGEIEGDANVLASVRDGDKVTVDRLE